MTLNAHIFDMAMKSGPAQAGRSWISAPMARLVIGLVIFWCLVFSLGLSPARAEKAQGKEQQAPQAKESQAAQKTLGKNVGEAVQQEAAKVKARLAAEARAVFHRQPLGFDLHTLAQVRQWLADLPSRVPALIQSLSKEMRLLGLMGSLVLCAFLAVVLYSLFGWKKVFGYLHQAATPLEALITDEYAPYLHAGLRVLAATLIPLILYGLFRLVQAFINFQASWFLLLGSLFKLWALGALVIGTLREILLSGLFTVPSPHTAAVYRISWWVIIYVLLNIAIFDGAKLSRLPPDILALLRFLISLSVIFASLFLLLKKDSILGLLPELPYKIYHILVSGLRRFYYPAVFLTFLTTLAWCFGYKNFAYFIWVKTWAVVGVFFGIIFLFHFIRMKLDNWLKAQEPADYQAVIVHKSLYRLIEYLAITFAIIAIFQLLSIFSPIVKVISLPLIKVSNRSISLWTFIELGILFLGIVFISSLIRSYLDYKIYPLLKVDEGLAYSISTLVKYLLFIIGIFIALSLVGLDIQTVMVFAGAIGVGIGLGLQKIAANFISGLIIIFGRKVRKGDWLQVGDTLGVVQRVTLASTIVWTRDNIQHLIPNTDLIANTIMNYTLSDPEVRVHVPVGVSYNADPQEVRRILLDAAERNENVKKTRKPRVWFTGYGDNSINFTLLVWIDVRRLSRSNIKSQLYFEIFQALREAGIEIPFPQRDLHLKSGWPPPEK
jgi:small-conductance mechanosensitive channel